MHFTLALLAATAILGASASPVELSERASCSTPPAGGAKSDTPWVICSDFDGKGATYDTKTTYSCDGESGTTGAVFIVQNGAKLSNVVLGTNQREGIHCAGPCTVDTVTVQRVCEDSFTVDGTATGSVTFKNIHILQGGKDKIIQHNGPASLTLQNIVVDNHGGKVYRSCGDGGCGGYKGARKVTASGVTVGGSGQEVFGVNQIDTISYSNVQVSNGRNICKVYDANGNKIGDCTNSGGSGGGSPTTTTKATTTKTTTTTKAASSPTSGAGGCSAQWAQCGGIGWTGPTCCVSGTKCTKNNDYYSQCV